MNLLGETSQYLKNLQNKKKKIQKIVSIQNAYNFFE